MSDFEKLTIRKASSLLRSKEVSATELNRHFLNIAEKKNKQTNAFLEIFDDIDAQSAVAQKLIDDGSADILTGIPIALKDNILIKGRQASAASKVLTNFVSPYDSSASANLRDKGAVFMGRTNMDEFAMGSSTENSAFGPTLNPHDHTRVAGGSSGGSAASVAMGGALAALGSDTGGSIRQPASFCGCVGLKTTYGAVSRFGLIAMASSLDQIGPITKSVDDAEIIFRAIKGTDKNDSTSFYPDDNSPRAVSRVGVPRSLLEIEGLSPEVKVNFEESLNKLKSMGFEIVDVELPNAKYALAVYYIIVPAEVSSNLARFDGVKYGLHKDGKDLLEDYFLTRREGFGEETRRRIILGTYVLSAGYYDAYYGKALGVRSLIRADFDKAFKAVDVIALPTTPTPAFKVGEKISDPLSMYLADIFTVPANIADIPALSVPSGFVKVKDKELPLGIQFMGRPYAESTLFAVGKKFLGEE
jgi:aspartyl-tRNA(Asn)/glutamyl-tRNA(Gln) amidotransferase subunit A